MELILMLVIGGMILLLAAAAMGRGIVDRVKAPMKEMKKQVSSLEQRVAELEKERHR